MAPAQAASYVQQIPGLGLAGHLNRDALADATPLAAAIHGLSNTVATTWRLYFD